MGSESSSSSKSVEHATAADKGAYCHISIQTITLFQHNYFLFLPFCFYSLNHPTAHTLRHITSRSPAATAWATQG